MRSRPERALDPYAILGIRPDASPDRVARAYRELAKLHHPDRAGSGAAARMAEINAAYAAIRDGGAPPRAPRTAPRPPVTPGAWLPTATRRALGPELVRALERDEAVVRIAECSTWDSLHVVLVLTDRRLLWLRDDAFANRVRNLPYAAVERVETRLRRPLRRVGELRVVPREGRRLAFGEVPAATLDVLARDVRDRVPPSRAA